MSTPPPSSGGLCARCRMTTPPLAVARILGDGTRQRTRAFTHLQSNYLFRDRLGRPVKENDKGKVVALEKTARHRFLVPVSEVPDLEALNERLLARCLERLDALERGRFPWPSASGGAVSISARAACLPQSLLLHARMAIGSADHSGSTPPPSGSFFAQGTILRESGPVISPGRYPRPGRAPSCRWRSSTSVRRLFPPARSRLLS